MSSAVVLRKPSWLRRPAGNDAAAVPLKKILRSASLNTVCEEARCPNISECFSRKTATFMILGDVCTRGCRFCAVHTGKPLLRPEAFRAEGERVAQASAELGLRHVVITSVARDDLADGGASGFYETVRAVKERLPRATIEVLIPDFRGSDAALETVLSAEPEILNHNLETVPRLYRRVRPGAGYRRSLDLLEKAKSLSPKVRTKTGIMLGLGEEEDEVVDLLKDARQSRVDIFTAGQYMQPSRSHLPVVEYVSPDRFEHFEKLARGIGFPEAFFGPLVRSSYHADEFATASESPGESLQLGTGTDR